VGRHWQGRRGGVRECQLPAVSDFFEILHELFCQVLREWGLALRVALVDEHLESLLALQRLLVLLQYFLWVLRKDVVCCKECPSEVEVAGWWLIRELKEESPKKQDAVMVGIG
jgi:hypothetical protein